MVQRFNKLSREWIRASREEFRAFLEDPFPNPQQSGERGAEYKYAEWLILFIAILSVKCDVKSYLGIHRLSPS